MTAAPALLDVDVLIALAWPQHPHHAGAHRWFDGHHARGWATTPVTESGFVRVSSNRAAVPDASSPAFALEALDRMTRLPGHRFWPDDVSAVVGGHVDRAAVRSHRDVTDAHLLALAVRHGGRLVTFDRGITRLVDGHPADRLLVLDA